MDREHSQVNSLLAEAANLIRREKKQQEMLNQQKAIREGKLKS